MRIYLQTNPTPDRASRFYHLHLQEDLISGWTLISETGQQGASGKVTKQQFDEWDKAQDAMIALRDKQIARGYRVVFVQGQTPPSA